ncbi:MAG: CRISPR-associated endonuclease Cas2 [Labilithrix sp.]|nr:CRISPR-associated endonuclease Cas2 [Labilithrix sp.]MCW5815787.1 CRISPR-associated endonuclease Cas2 [Labilithrix sp.]
MRQTFVVSYDISCPKRLRRVYRLMRGWGDHIQLSVFRCELNPRELVELRSRLVEIIHNVEDQVLFVDVGPVEGRGGTSIRAIGKVYTAPERQAIIV